MGNFGMIEYIEYMENTNTNTTNTTKFKKALFFFLEIIQIVAIALVIVLPIRYFIFQPFVVKGASMEPNFHENDYLVVDEISYRLRDPERGEVVVFKYPEDPSQRFIKRIVGLPGERVSLNNNKVQITTQEGEQFTLDESLYLVDLLWFGNKEVVLNKDEYFVMGDNRPHSFDSRRWGPLDREKIIGRVVLRAWPLDDISLISAPAYSLNL